MVESERGRGRPPIADEEERKVPLSASVRALTARRVETLMKITDEQKGPLIERLLSDAYDDLDAKINQGEKYFEDWLASKGFPDPPVSFLFDDDLTTRAFRCGDLTIYATERALYRLAISDNRVEAMSYADEALHYLERYQTRFARFDFIDGILNLGAPETVQHSLEALANKRVRIWVIGDDEPWVGQLTDFGNAIQLGALMGGPPRHNGTGLIPKPNVLRIEPLEF